MKMRFVYFFLFLLILVPLAYGDTTFFEGEDEVIIILQEAEASDFDNTLVILSVVIITTAMAVVVLIGVAFIAKLSKEGSIPPWFVKIVALVAFIVAFAFISFLMVELGSL